MNKVLPQHTYSIDFTRKPKKGSPKARTFFALVQKRLQGASTPKSTTVSRDIDAIVYGSDK